MEYLVGHRTACKCLRAVDSIDGFRRVAVTPSSSSIPDVPGLMRALESGGLRRKDGSAPRRMLKDAMDALQPLDLLVADGASRSNSKRVVCHVWNAPERSACYLDLGEGIGLSGPEACFLQLARTLDDVALMKLGFELCGSYSLDESMQVGFRNRKPLTDVRSLRAFADMMGSAKGAKRARRCLCYVRDGAASPMEACVALLLGLPLHLGGYGLGMPELNAMVSAPVGTRRKVGYPRYHCDLFWPDYKIAVEYNSRHYHLGEQAAARDSARMNDLATFGVTAFAVTRLQIADPVETDRLVRLIAGGMGKRLRCERDDIAFRRQELRRALFSRDGLL